MDGLIPKCPYCDGWSKKVTGADIYRGRTDLSRVVELVNSGEIL